MATAINGGAHPIPLGQDFSTGTRWAFGWIRQQPKGVNLRRRGDTGKARVDEGIYRHDLAHYGRAKTSARLVGTPFGYASRRAGFEPYVARQYPCWCITQSSRTPI